MCKFIRLQSIYSVDKRKKGANPKKGDKVEVSTEPVALCHHQSVASVRH